MPTFIDESGDTGPCADPAHCYFRLAAVWVPSHDEAEAIRAEIRGVRDTLGLRSGYEFKFSKTWSQPDQREAFFRAAMSRDFRFAFASIDKTQPYWREADKQTLHWATATDLAATLRPTYLAAHLDRIQNGGSGPLKELVVVDDNGDRRFLATVKQQFRGLGTKEYGCDAELYLVGKVKFRSSHPEELMQLVDMVCGASGASLDGENTWYRIIAERDLGAPLNRERAGEPYSSPPFRDRVAQSSA